ncbi:MAG: dihydrolipoamide acetyltransferase family protein [Gemmatimonadota bacterium]
MARIEVPMPQMGESIAEGTVSKWLKQPGDEIQRDEPLLEISTDKVDAEIPSPNAGTLVEVLVEEGATVEVGTIVAILETEKGAAAAAPAPKQDVGGGEKADAEPDAEAAEEPAAAAGGKAAGKAGEASGKAAGEAAGKAADKAAAPPAAEAQADGTAEETSAPAGEESAEERLRRRSTPVVRKIAAEHDIDIADVEGTGQAGRVTKQDIMAFIEGGGAEKKKAAAPAEKKPAAAAAGAGASGGAAGGAFSVDALWDAFYGQVRHPEFPVRDGDTVEPMNRMRRLTADHMVRAKRIAPHVHSFIEIDFTAIDRVRNAGKKKWAEQGVKVSYTAFVAWAVAKVLPGFPMVNGTVSGDSLIFRGAVNIGIAVDLNPGLIVPVIRNADELNLVGFAKRITDLAERARSKKLNPDEIQGATFSITNPGVLGTTVGMPVIPEGTSAILGTGAIDKKPVVIQADGQDTIAIRKRSLFSLGYDHRIVDGADAARFLATLKETLESFPEEAG